jgi:glycosyltransferase involved in cell wall biosynthesis
MAARIAYVLKMYPRFSQTFVVNELLAHQAAGRSVDIFSLRLPNDTRFHAAVSRVQSQVVRIARPAGRSSNFLGVLRRTAATLPATWQVIEENPAVNASDLEQSMHLALKAHQLGVDHLHAHFGTIATTTSRLAARMAGISYSFTAHAKDIYHESVDDADLRSKLADAAAVVTVSDYNLRYLKHKFGEAADRVVHINNGLDLDEFPFAEPTQRPPLILAVGRLVEKKGLGILVRACARLRDAGRDFRCEIAGGGVLAAELKGLVRDLGLESQVCLAGPQPQERIRERLHQASLLAAPCVVAADQDRDGLPTILVEAMAMGTPCISTDVTGIPEILIHGETGLQIPQHDDEALADACAYLLDHTAERVRMARQARAMVEREFDINTNARRIRELIDGVAAPSAG